MDNFFEILIYLFIIVSFLSSIFKKKKQAPQKPKQDIPQQREEPDISFSPSQEMESVSVKSSTTDDYDILKELEQFFKVGDPQQKPAPTPQPIIPPIRVEQKKKTVEDSWRTKTDSEHKYEDVWEKRTRDVAKRKNEVDSLTSRQAAKFEEMLKETKGYSTEFQRNIYKQLRHPSTLKEYIIISEIIGKPKALKHR
ncbi:MAG: hypothetical protein R6W68_11955 [Ignavibacteriaceae bacterium]